MKALSARSTWADPWLWVLLLLFASVLGGLGIARYLGYNAGMLDLGNMSQAIWSATQGQPLVYSSPRGMNLSRLSGHAELIYFLIAPLYALWPDPRTLVIVQALLYALGALPAYRMALRRTESRFAARCIALIYLCYPVAQTAVLFDFHGDTLAMPLLLFALDALDRRAWRSYALFIALALMCKMYIAAPVAGIGAYLWLWGGQRRVGLLTLAAALLYGSTVFLLLRPLFATHVSGAVETSRGYLDYYFGAFELVWATLSLRILNLLIVFGPALLVAWRGWRWLLPALPITAGVLLTSGPGGASDYRYHHYATIVPFVVMATIEGVGRMQARAAEQAASGTASTTPTATRRGRSWRGDLGLTAAIVAVCSAVLVDTPFNPLFWLGIPGQGQDPSVYGITTRDQVKDRFLAEMVPPQVPMAASNFMATHLSNRETLYLLRYPDEPDATRLPMLLPQVDVALADALFDYYIPLDGGYGGGIDYERGAIALLLRDPAFGLVAMRDGLLLFQRNAPLDQRLLHNIELLPSSAGTAVPERSFGDALELMQHQIELLDARRLRASFTWRAQRPLDQQPLVAVSMLAGVSDARIVHLPTYALIPTSQWQPGQLVRETFDVTLPQDIPPGEYTWHIGWYLTQSPFAAATDARSLLPGSQVETIATVTLP